MTPEKAMTFMADILQKVAYGELILADIELSDININIKLTKRRENETKKGTIVSSEQVDSCCFSPTL